MNTRICALLLALVATGASAEGMEERLRTQLRSTTQQLQALQSEQAQASAARLAAENQAKQAQAQIKQLTAELEKARGTAEQLAGQQQSLHSQAQAQVAASNEQIGKLFASRICSVAFEQRDSPQVMTRRVINVDGRTMSNRSWKVTQDRKLNCYV